jgi:outer membrane receptor protein involved in Fe transport
MTRSLIGIVVVALALSLSAEAQSGAASVSGAIKDQNAAVIANAKVQLLNMGSGQIQSVETDSSGTYLFPSVSLGSYQLSARGVGFANASRSIALRRDILYREDFVLVPGVIESNLTVTAGKGNARVAIETPQIVTVTESSRIEEQRPAATLRVVEQTPNLSAVIANAALERPRLRGLASNRLLIILDGERLNNARSDPTSGVSPSIVDATQLASMEVLSGAGSSLYGSDAMGGVINLITSEPARNSQTHYLGLRLNADLHGNGPYRRGAATINWNHSRFALRLSGSLFRAGNYHSGNQAIAQEEVVRLGNPPRNGKNRNSIARTCSLGLPAGAEI